MARLGMNPTRNNLYRIEARPDITLVMLTHIPHLAGYHKDRMSIVELSLQSMITNAGLQRKEFDVVIADNGSCREWKEKLYGWHESGYIDVLYLAGDNLGKCGILKRVLASVTSPIVGYTDDDILFFDRWLFHQSDLLGKWPDVAKVSGIPVKSLFPHYLLQANWLRDGVTKEVVTGSWPREWLEDDAMGRGISLKDYVDTHGDDDELVLEYKDVKAWAHGHHAQFLARTDLVVPFLPDCERKAMGRMREWDNNIQDTGKYQITTYQRTARHMGNVMDNIIYQQAVEMGLTI